MKQKWLVKFVLALLIGLLGLGLRLDAASKLPVDSDEDTYINAALHYASSIRRGEWKQIYKYDYNNQHPVLTKLSYAAALLPVFPADKLQSKDIPYKVPVQETEGKIWILAARQMAAVWGGLAVFALALINPLAGLLLAFHTTAIKFTSEIYLEAVPFFTSLLVLKAYNQWRKHEFGKQYPGSRRHWGWLAASGVFLGMTAAGKYIYCIVALGVLADFTLNLLADRRAIKKRLLSMLAWGLISIAAFFLFNPILWIYTLPRLSDSILFHINYTHSDNVIGSGRDWWYTVYLLFRPTADSYPWLKGVFYIEPDAWIALAALPGVWFLWRRHRSYALWLIISVLFLLVWATKWEQYILIAVPGLCLAAASLIEEGINYLIRRLPHKVLKHNRED